MLAYVVVWRSRSMPAAGFWYFRTEAAAEACAAGMRPECRAQVRPVEVPDAFDRWSE
jgi:hypothetical protein